MPDGFLDEKRATVRMAEFVAEHDAAEHAIEAGGVSGGSSARRRELAPEWLEYVWREKGAKPATLQDYGYLLGGAGHTAQARRGENPGRILGALGDPGSRRVTTTEVANFLRGLERGGMSARSVNKHREVLAAIFAYAQREDTTHSRTTRSPARASAAYAAGGS